MMCEKCQEYASVIDGLCETCGEENIDARIDEIMNDRTEAREVFSQLNSLQDDLTSMRKQRDAWKKRAELAEQRVQDMAAVHFDSLPND